MNWCERAVGKLLTETAQPGDIVMFPEISRMARSTLQVLEMLEHCARCGITVHVAKQKMVLDGSMQSHITATVLGLAAEIEREFISARTVKALARRKAQGLPLGRPKGAKAKKVKLDEHRETIVSYLRKGSANFPSPRSSSARPPRSTRGSTATHWRATCAERGTPKRDEWLRKQVKAC